MAQESCLPNFRSIAPKTGELGASKIWGSIEGIEKLQAIAVKLCTVTILGLRNMLARFQPNHPQIGELGAPKLWGSRAQLYQRFWPPVIVIIGQYCDSCYSRSVGWLLKRVNCGQTAGRIDFIFGKQVGWGTETLC